MKKIKVMTVFGTRPEAIKMAPLVKELKKYEEIDSKVCVTAQHRQMLDQVLEIFNIKPDYDLDIMQDRQTLGDITTRALTGLHGVFKEAEPDIVLVHGDTTQHLQLVGAFYTQVGLDVRGLRTYDGILHARNEPKAYRLYCRLHFPPPLPTRKSVKGEYLEQVIYVTGNTVIDALLILFRRIMFSQTAFEGFSLIIRNYF